MKAYDPGLPGYEGLLGQGVLEVTLLVIKV
jgi:hypothetical protein